MALAASLNMSSPHARPAPGGLSEVEIISQQVDEETKSIVPGQLVNFAYRDLPLAAVDLSTAGSQLLSNLDEDYQREGSTWLKPCCGKRAAVWQTVLRIVVLGIWDYIENKIEVFDGAVIILSLAPMVASTVANGPRSPWDAISLIILLRIWRVKRVIDAYVLPVKVEMEVVVQQYEKAKAIQDEQLERLTQICQEQGFEIRQLRAHLAQQDLDLAAEREEALRAPQVLRRPRSRYHVVEETATEGFVEELQPSPDSGVPEPALCLVTTAAVDIHQPNVSSDLFSVDVPLKLSGKGTCVSSTSEAVSCSTGGSVPGAQSNSSTVCSSRDGSAARDLSSEPSPSPLPPPPPQQQVTETTVQDLLSSLSEDPCPSQRALDPAPPAQPSPAGSSQPSPELEHRVSLFNQKNQEGFPVFPIQPVIHFQPAAPTLHKLRSLESKEQTLHRVPEA
ncbi:transmembrane protein 266 isoform X2 [Pteronotus mesoamericanus]|uniref:transmembrane protein 266 isoform X2 n=1 Tax=Pteronotus mesoamericanus TaxID=1884717 RepID=UPI0023EB32F9|nr:transmembrane protein 266 isoform X2 [Pteronotus parnellii mesoamericanus]